MGSCDENLFISFVFLSRVLSLLLYPRFAAQTRAARMSAKKKARIEHDPPQAGKDEAEQTGVLRSDAMFPTAKDFDAAAPYPHGHVENLLETTFYEQLRAEVSLVFLLGRSLLFCVVFQLIDGTSSKRT